MSKDSATMAALPDELLSLILETGVRSPTNSLTYQDLCSISISCRRLHRLSDQDSLWSHLLSSDFPHPSSTSSSASKAPNSTPPPSKSLYRIRFERDREKRRAAKRRAILRKESEIDVHSRKLQQVEISLQREVARLRATSTEFSNLLKSRQSAAALNVWQPAAVWVWQKQVVEQSPVDAESRIRSLEMELKLCKQQVKTYRKSREDELRRLDASRKELEALRYNPLEDYESRRDGGHESKPKRKRLKEM